MMHLLEFQSVQECPACGLGVNQVNTDTKYSTDPVFSGRNGDFISEQQLGAANVPHLQKHCRCGFGWLEKTKQHAGEER